MVFHSFLAVFILLRKCIALRYGIFQLTATHNSLALRWINPWSWAAFPIWLSSCSSWLGDTGV